MSKLKQDEILAHEIGLCRIAMVVDRFYRHEGGSPVLEEPLGVCGEWGDQRARLTYFWWVALGGRRLHDVDFSLLPKHVRTSVSSEQLETWMARLEEVASPIIGERLTGAWVEKAERLARKLLVVKQEEMAELAQAS